MLDRAEREVYNYVKDFMHSVKLPFSRREEEPE